MRDEHYWWVALIVVAIAVSAAFGGVELLPAPSYCLHIPPVCHAGQRPVCVCTGASRNTCAWMCVQQ